MKRYNDRYGDVGACVRQAIDEAMALYVARLSRGYYDFGVEATFQLHLSMALDEVLKTKTVSPTERYVVTPERNVPLDGRKDYIDVVIEHTDGNDKTAFLIELKYRKKKNGAQDLAAIEAYTDIYELERQLENGQSTFGGAYFIFMTDDELYLKEAKSGTTRRELPMYDGYTIKAYTPYTVSKESAKKEMRSYPDGFVFSKEHTVDYIAFEVNGTPYWYYRMEI